MLKVPGSRDAQTTCSTVTYSKLVGTVPSGGQIACRRRRPLCHARQRTPTILDLD